MKFILANTEMMNQGLEQGDILLKVLILLILRINNSKFMMMELMMISMQQELDQVLTMLFQQMMVEIFYRFNQIIVQVFNFLTTILDLLTPQAIHVMQHILSQLDPIQKFIFIMGLIESISQFKLLIPILHLR